MPAAVHHSAVRECRFGDVETTTGHRPDAPSALVALHGLGGAGLGLGLGLPELPLGAPLAEQVPALVELILELPQPGGIGARALAAQPVLLVDELVDAGEDVLVGGHGPHSATFDKRYVQPWANTIVAPESRHRGGGWSRV